MPEPDQSAPVVAANASRSARSRVRAELSKEILDAARSRLRLEGPAQLRLRAVARDLGMVPSAVYRYYDSRNALLTALIVDAYRSLGQAAQDADASVAPLDFPGRWFATTRAIRSWGLGHPHEWALIYGSPVVGYQAPTDTVEAALMVITALGGILGEAQRSGALAVTDHVVVPDDLASDLERLHLVLGEVPDQVAAGAVVALGYVLGAVSLELFGLYQNAIDARDSMWDVAMTLIARMVGLDVSAAPG